MIIKSNRQFGVEVEFYAPNDKAYRSVASLLNVHRDGSLDGKNYGLEFVTPILSGEKGESFLRSSCDILNKLGCSCSDPRTSMHIHLDGKLGDNTVVKYKSFEEGKTNFAFSRRVIRDVGEENCVQMALGNALRPQEIIRSELDGVVYFAYAKITKQPRLNYVYYEISMKDRFPWIQRAFYFYVQYSDVLEAMVNNSRKLGNMYCIPIGSSYSLQEIEDANQTDELRNVWYKGRYSGERYDDSRYHSVNFHSLFYRPGTIEIRCHGGTTDADKILLWVRLHQHILDKLEDVELNDIKPKSNDLYREFIEFIGDDELLVEYTKRLLGYFSGVRI